MGCSQKISTCISLLMGFSMAASPSPVVTDPNGQWAIADINPGKGNADGIVAQISTSVLKTGGISMTMNINGPRKIPGPIKYFIQSSSVASNGSCSASEVFDPQHRATSTPCDPKQPADCAAGDLSGKHGICESIPGCSLNFTDPYLSLKSGDPSYIGDKALVIQAENNTIIACGNFIMAADYPVSSVSSSVSSSSSSSSSVSSSSSSASTSSISSVSSTASTSASSSATAEWSTPSPTTSATSSTSSTGASPTPTSGSTSNMLHYGLISKARSLALVVSILAWAII